MDTEQDFEGTSTHRAPFTSPVYDYLAWGLITKFLKVDYHNFGGWLLNCRS